MWANRDIIINIIRCRSQSFLYMKMVNQTLLCQRNHFHIICVTFDLCSDSEGQFIFTLFLAMQF